MGLYLQNVSIVCIMYYKTNKKKHIINTQCLTNPNRSALVELLADSFKTDHNMGFDNTNYITI